MIFFYSLGDVTFGSLADADATPVQTVTTTKYFSTHSFPTGEFDSPAHTHVEGRTTKGFQLSRRLSAEAEGQAGSFIETNFGEIELSNIDGGLDYLIGGYHADGQRIRIKIGAKQIDAHGREDVQPYNQFELVSKGIIAGAPTIGHDTVTFRITSLVERLKDRMQTQTYIGAGGIFGTTDMTGRTKPLAFGECLNVPAQSLDPLLFIYQLSSDSIEEIMNVYDGGIVFPRADTVTPAGTADYPNYASLEAASGSGSIPDGTYSSCLAEGCIALGSSAFGTVTADIKGDNSGIGYRDTHGGIIEKIWRDFSSILDVDIDVVSIATFITFQDGVIGLFLPAGDQSTIFDVCKRIAFSGGAYFGQDRSGLLRVKRFDAPLSSPAWTFDERDIARDESNNPLIEKLDLPYGVPWKNWNVAYQHNWTVQGSSDVFLGVSPSRKIFLESEDRFAFAQSTQIAENHLTSHGAPNRPSLFRSQGKAGTEATRLLNLYSYGRGMYRFVVKTALFSIEIGQTVRITANRWDLKQGKNLVVVGVDDDAERVESAVTAFG